MSRLFKILVILLLSFPFMGNDGSGVSGKSVGNGFDNGGLSGVCKWAQNPDEVEFVLGVLERLAKRYGTRKGLMGI